LGQYACILIGLDGGGKLDVSAQIGKSIIYLRPMGETQIDIEAFEDNPANPRFGKPVMYKAIFEDPKSKKVKSGRTSGFRRADMNIHWSHLVHIVENPLDDDILSMPIMQKVFNILDDLLKVSGGTSETYWLTANRGMQADVDKEMEIDPQDAEDLAEEIEEYQHQLRRFIRTRGVKLNVLQSTTPNPKEIFEMLISIISGTTGIPKRILIGAEAGQLASEQDRANWAERIVDRRNLHADPYILKPFVKHLQMLGILPEGEFKWKWPQAFRVSPLENAQTMAAQARAVGNLSRQIGNNAPMQITSREEARAIVGLEGDLPESEIIEQPVDDGNAPPGDGGEDEGGQSGQGGQGRPPPTAEE
jgi:hypothetical protein